MIREAQLADIPLIREMINSHAEKQRMLFRSLANLYESTRDFKVCEKDGEVIGCCALQIVWSDLAEIKSLAVKVGHQGKGVGTQLVEGIIGEARALKLPRVFTLTLEPRFFEKMGFKKVAKESLPMKVWSDCVRCPKQDQCDEIAMLLEL